MFVPHIVTHAGGSDGRSTTRARNSAGALDGGLCGDRGDGLQRGLGAAFTHDAADATVGLVAIVARGGPWRYGLARVHAPSAGG